MTKDEALRMALEALEAMQMYAEAERKGLRICDETITAIKKALAQPEPEPVECMCGLCKLGPKKEKNT